MVRLDIRLQAELELSLLSHEDRNGVQQAILTAARTQLGRKASGTNADAYHYVDIRTERYLVRAYYSMEDASEEELFVKVWDLDFRYLSPQ